MVFVLDNYDSFTYNLVQYIGELGAEVFSGAGEKIREDERARHSGIGNEPSLSDICREIIVKRNDEVTPEQIVAMRPDRILLSPGPCTPQDAGILIPLIEHLASLPAAEQIPVLGVCLGHQAIGAAFGGDVIRAPRLMHGKTSQVVHDNRSVFHGLPQPMTCTRYHSLIVAEESLPEDLEVSAWTEASVDASGATEKPIIMGLRHRTLPIEGVQFHPESVLTDHGKRLIENFLKQ
jgi:para-aminobenzoate synthetase component 2